MEKIIINEAPEIIDLTECEVIDCNEVEEIELEEIPEEPELIEIPEIKGDRGEDGEDGYTPVKGVDYFDGKDGKQGPKGKDGKTPTKTELKAFIKEMFPEDKLLEKLIKKLPKAEVDSIEIGEDNNGQWIAKNGKKMYIKKQFSVGSGMSTGVYDFIALRDAPDSYVGQAGKFPRVKTTEDGLEFADVATATPTLQEVTDVGAVTTTTIESAGFIKTGGTSSQFLKADGSVDNTTYGTGTIDGTMTAGRVVLAQDANTVETDDDLSFNGSALGIGTTTPLARRLHTVNPTATFTTITGTVSFSNVVFVGNVTGTGTLFTTEFKVGDFLVHPTQDAQKAMVLRIVSNTSMQILTMNALFISGSGTGYRRLDRTNAVIDTSGTTISTESYGQFNTFTGAGNVPTRILNGTTFFQNIEAPQHGLIIDTVANDGRIRIGHSESLNANIIFQHGNANIGINYATLSNALWSMPLYLGLASFGSNQTGIYMERSGTGANQQIRQWTTRFAVHGDAPSFQMSANGLDFGRRDGSVWNEGIDAITLSMDKTTGRWKFGSFGTSTPTGATSRVHIVETNGYEQFRLETPYTPTSSADTNGETGQVVWDDDYVHIKTSTGWKKTAITTSGSGGGGMTQGQVLARTLGA